MSSPVGTSRTCPGSFSSPVDTSRACPALWALPGQHRERVHLPGHFQDLSNPVGTSRTCTGKVSSPVGTSRTCPALWALPGAAQRACPSMWALPGPFHLPGRFQDLSSPMGIPGQSQGRGQLGGRVTQRWHVRNVTPGWLQQPGEQRGTAQAPQPHPLHKRWEIRAAPSCSRCPARPGMPAGMHPHTPNRCSRAGKGLTLTPGSSHKVKEKENSFFPGIAQQRYGLDTWKTQNLEPISLGKPNAQNPPGAFRI